MTINNKRSITIIFLTLFFGCIIGTALSQLFGATLPEGVVKDFLINSTSIGWGNSNEWIDFNVMWKFTSLFWGWLFYANIY